MSADGRVETRHPIPGKQNVPVARGAYELFKAAIAAALAEGELTHSELVEAVRRELAGTFTGNVSWHVMTVKLDLEARGTIERTPTRPQRYRLAT